MLKWKNDAGVSIWLSKMVTLITEMNGKKVRMKNTQMSAVKIENQYHISPEISQMSLADLEEYLNTLKDESEIID